MNDLSANQPVSLGTRSARGVLYLFAGASVTRVVGILSQLVLLYLLGHTDFGVVALAMTITEFIVVIGQAGVGDMLIHRRAFRQWSVPGFWLSLAQGVVSCALILASAPIAPMVFGDSVELKAQLYWVLIILAPSPLFYALSVVPRAQLSHELRFGGLAVMNIAEVAILNVLMVIFAVLGFGPYSFVYPTTLTALIMAGLLWIWVRPYWAPQLRLRRWRYMIGDSAHLLSAEFGRKLLDQSDYITLGLFQSVAIVGVYTVGFRFSIQVARLLMVNMQRILFPAFTKLNDKPQQQYQGFFKSQRILAMVGVSGCLLQAALAEPLAHLLFPAKWHSSIIVMQILSLGMSTRMVIGGSHSLLKSHGRFRIISISYWAFAGVQLVMLLATLLAGGGIVSVSIVVSLVASSMGPLMLYQAIKPFGGSWRDVADVLFRPLVSGIISVGTAWLLGEWLKSRGHGDIIRFVEIAAVALGLNVLCAWLWMRPVWDDLWVRIRRMLPSARSRMTPG